MAPRPVADHVQHPLLVAALVVGIAVGDVGAEYVQVALVGGVTHRGDDRADLVLGCGAL